MFNQWFKTDVFRPKKLHLRFCRHFSRWNGGNFWAEKIQLNSMLGIKREKGVTPIYLPSFTSKKSS